MLGEGCVTIRPQSICTSLLEHWCATQEHGGDSTCGCIILTVTDMINATKETLG